MKPQCRDDPLNGTRAEIWMQDLKANFRVPNIGGGLGSHAFYTAAGNGRGIGSGSHATPSQVKVQR